MGHGSSGGCGDYVGLEAVLRWVGDDIASLLLCLVGLALFLVVMVRLLAAVLLLLLLLLVLSCQA